MRKKSVLNKTALKNSILKVFQEFPFKKFNYKQVSKCIGVKKLGEKILVFEAMNDLKKDGRLEELKRGSFSLVQKNVSQQGTVLFSNKSGVTVELENKNLVSVDKKDSLFSLKGDIVEIVYIKSKKTLTLVLSQMFLRENVLLLLELFKKTTALLFSFLMTTKSILMFF